MRPSMTCHLMSFGNHTLDGSRPWQARIVNRALANIDSSDEESRLCISSLELIQYTFSVDIRTIIVRDSNRVRLSAVVDTLSTIGLVAKLRTSNVTSASSSWNPIGIAGWAILELAVWCLAIIISLTTVTCYRATISLSTASTAIARSASTISTTLTSCQTMLGSCDVRMCRMSTQNVPGPEFSSIPWSQANDLRKREVAVSSHKRCDQARSTKSGETHYDNSV